MNKRFSFNTDIVVSVLLIVATIAVIILQVVFAGPESSKLETTLFSILQFVFSLAFSWILARISLRNEFQQSQKRFAISAYRRIIEINNAVDRLLYRINSNLGKVEPEANHELDVINEIGMGIRESIRSSVSDWADIIGEEIETINKIQNIREKQNAVENTPNEDELVKLVSDVSSKADEEKDIQHLRSKLPKSLQIISDESINNYGARLAKTKKLLKHEELKNGHISVKGFYESSLDKDIYDCRVGEILKVRIGDDKENRIGALIAYDDKDNSVGIIINKLAGVANSYFDAVDLLFHYLGKSQFSIEIIEIEKGKSQDERHYFTAKILRQKGMKRRGKKIL